MQTVLKVPRSAATVDDFAGFRSYNFELTGEVVLDGELFETFRYKFGFPENVVGRRRHPDGVPALPAARATTRW